MQHRKIRMTGPLIGRQKETVTNYVVMKNKAVKFGKDGISKIYKFLSYHCLQRHLSGHKVSVYKKLFCFTLSSTNYSLSFNKKQGEGKKIDALPFVRYQKNVTNYFLVKTKSDEMFS